MHEHFEVGFFVCKCALIIFNVAFLTIGILLYKGISSGYGTTIQSITQEWSNPAITDVIMRTQKEGCSAIGYTVATGKYYGTNTICNYFGQSYFVGTCSKRDPGYTQYGMTESTLFTFNGGFVCMKQSTQNYHTLNKMRKVKGLCPSSSCGSPDDADKLFCGSASMQCPINSLQIVQKAEADQMTAQNNSPAAFGSNGWYSLSKTNSTGNPISGIYIAVSKQCGDLSKDYMQRPWPIANVYSTGDSCSFNNNGVMTSSYSSETKFVQTEYDVYTQNGITDKIREWFPGNFFNAQELQKNSFRIYSRTYALFSQSCSGQTSTEEMSSIAQEMGNISTKMLVIMIISIVIFVLEIILLCFSCICSKSNRGGCCRFGVGIFHACFTLALFLTNIGLYASLLYQMKAIDMNKINYFADSNCSDGDLQYSVQAYRNYFQEDMLKANLGIAFNIVTLIFHMVPYLFCTPIRDRILAPCRRCSDAKMFQERPPEAIARHHTDQFLALSMVQYVRGNFKTQLANQVAQSSRFAGVLKAVQDQKDAEEMERTPIPMGQKDDSQIISLDSNHLGPNNMM